MASVLKFQTDFFHDFVVQRFFSSRAHPNGIFCKCTWKSGSVVMEKMFCITVLIRETFNVRIMLNMLRKNIENTTRAKALIEFCLSHGDVARVLSFCIPQYTANGKVLHIQRVKCTLTT